MGENEAFFFFLGKGDGLPPESPNFAVAPFSDTEDPRMPNGTHVIFDGPIAGIGNWCIAADHVDMAIVGCSRADCALRCWSSLPSLISFSTIFGGRCMIQYHGHCTGGIGRTLPYLCRLVEGASGCWASKLSDFRPWTCS
ncbi:unnamed protein product [Prunus armeniaca]